MNRTNVFIDQIAEAFCEMTRATHEQQAELVNAMRTIALHAVAEDENIRVISLRDDLLRVAQIQQDSKQYK